MDPPTGGSVVAAVVVSTLVSGGIDALRRLERDRSMLLRSVSHDLRADRASRLRDDVTVVTQATDEGRVILADHVQLDQLLSNLLENAVRHSPGGATVELRITTLDRRVQLSVADRGPGVTPAEANAIFQPFRSGELAGSSGVGLAIRHAITQSHGGTIDVHDHQGGGAEFVVELPVD